MPDYKLSLVYEHNATMVPLEYTGNVSSLFPRLVLTSFGRHSSYMTPNLLAVVKKKSNRNEKEHQRKYCLFDSSNYVDTHATLLT